MELDFVLDYQGLVLVVDLFVEFGGNGMMGRGILDDKAFVAINGFQHMRLLDGPFSDIGPILVCLRVLFLGVRWLPSRVPIVGKLFEEWSFDVCGLGRLISTQ